MSETHSGRQPHNGGRAKNPEGRMPLSDHLRELRNRLVICVAALVVTIIVGFVINHWIVDRLTEPICDIGGVHGFGPSTSQCHNGVMSVSGPLGGLSFQFKIALLAGFIMACPVWSYQLWAFIAPGLYKKEKRYGLGFAGAAAPLFVGGAALAYWVFPKAMRILLHFTPGGFAQNLDGSQFIDFFMRMILVFGLAFEIPLLLVLLNFIGVLSSARLRGWWRIIVFLIFVFAAVATPTGDPVTMTVLAVPMCVLFVLALGVTALNDRRRARRRAMDPDAALSPDEASRIDVDDHGPEVEPVTADATPVAERVSAEPLDHGRDAAAFDDAT